MAIVRQMFAHRKKLGEIANGFNHRQRTRITAELAYKKTYVGRRRFKPFWI